MWSQLFLIVTSLYSANQAFPGLAAAHRRAGQGLLWVNSATAALSEIGVNRPRIDEPTVKECRPAAKREETR
jgi:hypothetical protein